MKISEQWLRSWVNPKLKLDALCDALTMAGFEVEEHTPVAGDVGNVIVAEVLSVTKHPEADRLNICEVFVGKNKTFKIVCGAPNVHAGMKAALMLTPPKTIRGVTSEGMLCSAAELGLSENNDGLIELDAAAKVGTSLTDYLKLNDSIITISVMPDRGDCLSVKGMSREVAAITKSKWNDLKIKPVKATIKDKIKIKINDKKGCPHYIGRIIRNVEANVKSPLWLQEALRRSGTRSISAIVDVTNYVLFELGQPMHAFDLNKINGEIQVRKAKEGEKIKLLDESEKTLTDFTMVIADKHEPLAIAGVMGGMPSSVTTETTDILLESAFFTPETIARQRQYFNLNSDSSYRFERGVDPELQKVAIERATQLILNICGGEAGPVIEEKIAASMPKKAKVTLTKAHLTDVLGINVPEKNVAEIFKSLHFQTKRTKDKWQVQAPSYRFDITLPEDLIEEVGRLYGYDKIPERALQGELALADTGGDEDYGVIRQILCTLGYHEVVSYSFIDSNLQELFDPDQKPETLINPITAEMSVMRTNLWPGLLSTLQYNRARQQHRVRLFEIGTCFIADKTGLTQVPRLSGLISGSDYQEQWGHQSRDIDFYDLKGDVETLLRFLVGNQQITFEPTTHSSLHPGQSAKILMKGRVIGIMGALNPNLLQKLDVAGPVMVFEIDVTQIQNVKPTSFQEISKFPEIRRDIAIIVNEAVPSKEIQDTITKVAGDWLKDVFIFDVYNGKGITTGHKSIALGLVLQHPTRTLIDDEVTELMERVVSTLQGNLGAELRK